LEMSVWVRAASSHKSQVTVYDLVDGTVYVFRIRAVNIYGTSDPCAETEPILIPEITSEYCGARKYNNNVHTLQEEETDKEMYSFNQDTVSEKAVGETFNYREYTEDELLGKTNEDELLGKTNEYELFGKTSGDELFGNTNEDELIGKTNEDELFGKTNGDELIGKTNEDELFGNTNEDEPIGNTNEDKLFGNTNEDELIGKTNEDELFGKTNGDELERVTDEEKENEYDLLTTSDSDEEWELASEGVVETLEDIVCSSEGHETVHSSALKRTEVEEDKTHLVGSSSCEDKLPEGPSIISDPPTEEAREHSSFPSVSTVPAMPLLRCIIYEPFVWEAQMLHHGVMSDMPDVGINAETVADIRSLEPLTPEICYARWVVEDIHHCAAMLSLLDFPGTLELAKPFNSQQAETNRCRISLAELLFRVTVSQDDVQFCEAVGWLSDQTFVCNTVLELPNHVLCVNILPPLLLQTSFFSSGKHCTDKKRLSGNARTSVEPCLDYLIIQLPPQQMEVPTVIKSSSLKAPCRVLPYLCLLESSITLAETFISTSLDCVELSPESSFLIEPTPPTIIHHSFIIPHIQLSQRVHCIEPDNNSSYNESSDQNIRKKGELISVDNHLKKDFELDNCGDNPPALVRSPAVVNLGHILQQETSKSLQKDIQSDFQKTLGCNVDSDLSDSEDSDSKPSSTDKDENNEEDSITEISKIAEEIEKEFETKANEIENLEKTLTEELVSLESDMELIRSIQEQFDIESYNKIDKAKLEIKLEDDDEISSTFFKKVQDETNNLKNSEVTNDDLLHPLRRLHRTQMYRNQNEIFKTRDETPSSHEHSVDLSDRRRSGRLQNREVSPPHVITHLENRLIPAGYRVKLTCWILADPEPHIQWLKNGTKLQPKLRHLAMDMYDFGLCSLEIFNAKPSDTGQYTCVATNCFGTCSTTGYLRVG
ncbi:uncharacterized protein LOC106477125, partial [Limulus polyphemus]|uniref:Uncharacterized protein LOC106477125 n=1 Tax=Limulus polyphemus TaxID=6850 RepID=A0ABM1C2R6_LIMPO